MPLAQLVVGLGLIELLGSPLRLPLRIIAQPFARGGPRRRLGRLELGCALRLRLPLRRRHPLPLELALRLLGQSAPGRVEGGVAARTSATFFDASCFCFFIDARSARIRAISRYSACRGVSAQGGGRRGGPGAP